jgi:hypothetical protein
MWQLTDITIYCDGEKEPWTEFRFETNYVSDMYHNRLDGYKPHKTGRICLHLRDKKIFEKPNYFGAICSYEVEFDFTKYNAIESKSERYKFILDSIHKTILEMADILNWDKDVFIKSYDSILRDNFKFIKEYPKKTSRDKKSVGQVTIEKTETRTILRLKISNGQRLEIKLLEKKNWFWFDSGYQLADKMKWIDKNNFGYKSKKSDKEVYYSLADSRVVKNFEFNDEDF